MFTPEKKASKFFKKQAQRRGGLTASSLSLKFLAIFEKI